MKTKINDLNSLDSKLGLQELTDSQAAQIAGGASSTFTSTSTFVSEFSSDGTGFTEEITRNSNSFFERTRTDFNADGTTLISGEGVSPAVLPPMPR